ncbi:hypothetical protein CDCA_CDCA16G4142 [Cyanidium caldarium]|uniref:Ubiquitin carboxyl-terminal hydrolase n=1 Tax=Cyanidium caldarium TaxID=2771 RepID=A0AAV9J0M4_CYACA|nr:hypothetical protein CDCA_CDCA16G4142 [Cyanidium caldarium]
MSNGGSSARLRLEAHARSLPPSRRERYCGLLNYGNTCYANSVIQALYFCEPFRSEVLRYHAELERRRERLRRGKASSVAALRGNGTDEPDDGYPYRHDMLPVNDNMLTALADLFADMHRNCHRVAGASTQESSSSSSSSSSMSSLGNSPSSPSHPARLHNNNNNNNNNNNHHRPILYTGTVEPRSFISRLRQENGLFSGHMHQDSHELLNFLLNQCSDLVAQDRQLCDDERAVRGLPPLPNPRRTFVEDIFQGELVNETRCLGCETVTRRQEHFLDLSLDIEQQTSITACLRNFSAREMLRADDKFYCEVCRTLQEAEKRMLVRRLPQVLALHLKRFKYSEATQKALRKLNYHIAFPLELRLCNASEDAIDGDALFELFAVVVHVGAEPSHGHYVTLAKSSGGAWVLFDDDQVEAVEDYSLQEVYGISESGCSVTGGTSSDCGYIFFYRRRRKA